MSSGSLCPCYRGNQLACPIHGPLAKTEAVTDQQSAEVEALNLREFEYAQIDHRLRGLLFGDGDTSSGYVKGEAARLAVSAELNHFQAWRKQLQQERDALAQRIETLTAEASTNHLSWEGAVGSLKLAEERIETLTQERDAAALELVREIPRTARAEAQRDRLAEALHCIADEGEYFDQGKWIHEPSLIAALVLSEIEQAASSDGEKEAVT